LTCHHLDTSSLHAQDASQIRPARKDLRHLRPAVHMAQEMGKALGRSEVLLRPLPQSQTRKNLSRVTHFAPTFGVSNQGVRWALLWRRTIRCFGYPFGPPLIQGWTLRLKQV
jgi:hypothetical protein